MSTGTHYIGSKISLISKAEIRYEGVLYQVDTKEATVTLAKVRSFGTEGRPAPKTIPARSEIYEFIIFRGSDIKDLHVSEMPTASPEEDVGPQDPAILSAQSVAPPPSTTTSTSLPLPTPSQIGPPPPSMAPSHPPHPPPPGSGGSGGGGGTSGPAYSPFPPPNMGGYSPFGMPYFRPPHMMPGSAPPPHAFGPMPPAPPPVVPGTHQTIGPSQTHPSASNSQIQPPHGALQSSQAQPLLPRPPPPLSSQNQLPFFAPPPPQIITPPKTATVPVVPGANPPPATVLATPSVAPASSEAKPQASSTPMMAATQQTSAPETTPKASLPLDSESPGAPSNTIAHPPVQVDQPPPQTSAAVAPGSMEESTTTTTVKPQAVNHEGGGGGEGHRNYTSGGGEKRRPNSSHQSSRSGGYRGHGGQGDYHRGPPRGGRPQGQRRGSGGGGGGTFRYDSEFDFESANARFNKEVLEEEFKQKLSIDDHSSTHSRRTSEGNEGAESPTSDDVIVEDVAGGIEGSENGGAESDYYDKSKSFFDNISCESSAPGRSHRPSRNEEREMNTETFGVSSVRGYGYRGYRRGRGRGGRGRGGYYRGRGGRNYYGRGGGGGAYNQKGRGGNRRGGRGNYQDSSASQQQHRRTQDQ